MLLDLHRSPVDLLTFGEEYAVLLLRLEWDLSSNEPDYAIVTDALEPFKVAEETIGGITMDGPGDFTFTATGLPPGVAMETVGVYYGFPQVAGPFTVTVTATDAFNRSTSRTYEIVVDGEDGFAVGDTLAPGVVGQSYDREFEVQGTGTSIEILNEAELQLIGLSFDGQDSLVGTPTRTGDYIAQSRVTNRYEEVIEQDVSFTIESSPLIPLFWSSPEPGTVFELQDELRFSVAGISSAVSYQWEFSMNGELVRTLDSPGPELVVPPSLARSFDAGDVTVSVRAVIDAVSGALTPAAERDFVFLPAVNDPCLVAPAVGSVLRLTQDIVIEACEQEGAAFYLIGIYQGDDAAPRIENVRDFGESDRNFTIPAASDQFGVLVPGEARISVRVFVNGQYTEEFQFPVTLTIPDPNLPCLEHVGPFEQLAGTFYNRYTITEGLRIGIWDGVEIESCDPLPDGATASRVSFFQPVAAVDRIEGSDSGSYFFNVSDTGVHATMVSGPGQIGISFLIDGVWTDDRRLNVEFIFVPPPPPVDT